MAPLLVTAESRGNAQILAIGTANPPNYILQEDYPDFYFRITDSEHMVALKEKFKRMCGKSAIRKRHFYLTEDILKKNDGLLTYGVPSMDSRQNICETVVPNLAKEAALVAIGEWGQPVSNITHVVFATSSGFMMPGADYAITKLLDLKPNVKRVMLYCQGCFAGGTALRVAKDLAENNKSARVLVICAENMALLFHGPNDKHLDLLVGQAVFADGAAALIVGANPNVPEERPIFEMVAANQNILPESQGAITAHFLNMGTTYCLREDGPRLFGKNMEAVLREAFNPLGINDLNSLFYAVHPGARKILDVIAENLALKDENLAATRHVLSEYGNMGSTSVLFILDELRKRAKEEKKATTGDGKEYGVLLGIGAGLTVESVVLRSVPIA